MAVRILITGGTFDKEYNELTGQLFFKDTHMHDLLEMGRSKVPVEIRTL
ncbi:MAG: asparaginase, partial [Bacteroidota bacterium]